VDGIDEGVVAGESDGEFDGSEEMECDKVFAASASLGNSNSIKCSLPDGLSDGDTSIFNSCNISSSL